jgi:RNA polymerase sigma-70 factor (ECF subfamily)
MDREVDAAVRSAVARGRGGDSEALHYLYTRFHGAVRDHAMAIVKDPFEAEDIAHIAFLKVITQLESYDEDRGPFRAWVLRVARNAAIDQVRRRRDVLCAELPEPRRPPAMGPPAIHGTMVIRQAMGTLPVAQAEVVLLRLMLGYTPPEIAALTGRSVSSVNNLLHRGRLALRLVIGELGEGHEPPMQIAA